LALHNYHDAHKAFVYRKGGTGADPRPHNAYRRSGFMSLLPFIEQAPMWDQIKAGGGNPNSPPEGPEGWSSWSLWNVSPSFLRCPSDGGLGETTRTQVNSLGFCIGDQVRGIRDDRTPRGIFGSRDCTKIGDINDGTSNTIMMAERKCSGAVPYAQAGSQAAANQVPIKQGIAIGAGPIISSPGSCYNVVAGQYYTAGTTVQGTWGKYWHDGQPMYVGFNTVLPPNGPACSEDGGNWGDRVHLAIPPTSDHPGGVNGVFADGSVRFITDTIDTGNLGAEQFDSGPSVYGVWGAMGSKSGGDQVSEG
jgi:prepilin-type processing-associated H-X9-DG protein